MNLQLQVAVTFLQLAALPTGLNGVTMYIREHADHGALVSCPRGFVINVEHGYYGRNPDDTFCIYRVSSNDSCVATGSLEKIRSFCQGKAECYMRARNDVFGSDPCPGVWKYIFLFYSCTATDRGTATTTSSLSSSIASNTQASTDPFTPALRSEVMTKDSVTTQETCERDSAAALAIAGVGWTCTGLLVCINIYITLRGRHYLAVARNSKLSRSNFDEKMEENPAYRVIQSGLQAAGTPPYDRPEYEDVNDRTEQSDSTV
jgi:hypothetical protein